MAHSRRPTVRPTDASRRPSQDEQAATPGVVALGLLDAHARHCVVGGQGNGEPEELTDELMAAVGRLMRRG